MQFLAIEEGILAGPLAVVDSYFFVALVAGEVEEL